MKNFSLICLLSILGLFMVSGGQAAPKAKSKPPRACVTIVHVIKGCSACESMQTWLRKGGVELDITSVPQGAYKLYPMVIYSDNVKDHGDRMYKQEVVIPDKICVISCSVGME